MASAGESEILSEIDGYAGVITLNRPKALNALSHFMIREISRLLLEWKDDPKVSTIIIQSGDDKAFCAGGDIRCLYEAHLQGDHDFMRTFFQEEYLLNYMIHMYPKPYISLINGIAMGGGLGISIHGSHRIVTERASMAMPEVKIGLFPDIGAGFFLNQCPGKIGTFLSVLGETIRAEDALYASLATHRIDSSDIPAIYNALVGARSQDEVNDILQDAAGGQRDCSLQTHRSMIDRCFAYNTVEEIMDALNQDSNPIASSWLKGMYKKSPTSQKLALALLHRTKGMRLKEVLALDFRVSQHCVKSHDFFEGVRAVLIDKDQNPIWSPSQLSDVSQEMIEAYFSPSS